MAGRARTKALTEELEKRAWEASDDDLAPMSTLEYCALWIEGGRTLKSLALDLSSQAIGEVTYERLMAVLRAAHGEERVTVALELARTRASHCLAEESLDIVDAPAETNVDVSRAASRAKSRQWLAQSWNRKAYGQDKGVSVSVTVGSLHLDALRMFPPKVTGASQPALPSPAVTDTVDAEVIEP